MSRAEHLAVSLRGRGIARGSIVGVRLERSFERVATILAVNAVGAAFLPLDPTWPDEYVRQVLDDAGAGLVIGEDGWRPTLADGYNRAGAGWGGAPDVSDGDLAYVVYTSGSTGVPKGVEITHGNLQNLIDWHLRAFDVSENDRVSHVAGLGFDAAIWEVWPALAAGACVTLVPEAYRRSWWALQSWLVEEGITIAFVPTLLAEPMIAAPWPPSTKLKLLLTGGGVLHRSPRPGLPFTVVNNYGPTECTVVATSGVVPPAPSDATPPPIGRPIKNVAIEILDGSGRPVPPGQTGEIVISGASVGRGYRNRPEHTAERFVWSGRGLAYRTGDLGCLLPDGQVAFRGRVDGQEKIRGHRVEPGEIVHALNRHPMVSASAVVGRGAPSDRHLVAYVVAREGETPTAPDLRAHLATLLPAPLIPATFVALPHLPVTSSGKLDHAALPEPSPFNALASTQYQPPSTPTEEGVAKILRDLLRLDRVGVEDDFFLLGGHSLLATQVVLRCQEDFRVDLKLLHLFEARTVANLAAVIEDLIVAKLATISEDDARLLLIG